MFSVNFDKGRYMEGRSITFPPMWPEAPLWSEQQESEKGLGKTDITSKDWLHVNEHLFPKDDDSDIEGLEKHYELMGWPGFDAPSPNGENSDNDDLVNLMAGLMGPEELLHVSIDFGDNSQTIKLPEPRKELSFSKNLLNWQIQKGQFQSEMAEWRKLLENSFANKGLVCPQSAPPPMKVFGRVELFEKNNLTPVTVITLLKCIATEYDYKNLVTNHLEETGAFAKGMNFSKNGSLEGDYMLKMLLFVVCAPTEQSKSKDYFFMPSTYSLGKNKQHEHFHKKSLTDGEDLKGVLKTMNIDGYEAEWLDEGEGYPHVSVYLTKRGLDNVFYFKDPSE